MTFASFLTYLIVPLNLCVTCLVISVLFFIFRRRKTALVIAVAGLGWATFWSLPASSLWAGGRLEQLYPPVLPAKLPTTHAILVLGGHQAQHPPKDSKRGGE